MISHFKSSKDWKTHKVATQTRKQKWKALKIKCRCEFPKMTFVIYNSPVILSAFTGSSGIWVFVSSDLSLSVRSIYAWLAKVSIRERDLPLFHPFMNVTLHLITFGYLLFILSHRSTRIFSSKPRPKTQRQALICSKIDAFWFLTGSVFGVWSLMGWYHLLVIFTAICCFQ